MIKQNQRILNLINVLSDVFLIFLSYILAAYLRFNVLGGDKNNPLSLSNYYTLWMTAVYSFSVVILFYLAGLYDSIRLKRIGAAYLKIIIINSFGVSLVIVVLFVKRLESFSRIALLLFWAISSALIILKKYAVKAFLIRIRSNYKNLKHLIVVGDGKLAHGFLDNVKQHPEYGLWVDGYISSSAKPELGKNFGSYEQINEILKKNDFDSVVVALEPHEVSFMKLILDAVDKEGVKVSLIPFYNDYIPAYPAIETVGSTKLIDLRSTPLNQIGWDTVKRLIDFIGSLMLIIITSPIMIVAAIGVKLTSPGPVFFKQERVGKNNKNFNMLKFRSMRTDIDTTGWSTQNDPRRTKFGSFIRKYSIDELPQLFNVFLGHMSLVGPRPEIPKYVRQFKEEVPLYLLRQQVRPGMTGWAQVHGLRGDTSIEDRVQYDIWYIENWTLGLDFRILLKTALGGFINDEK